jgi:hypothetical protein
MSFPRRQESGGFCEVARRNAGVVMRRDLIEAGLNEAADARAIYGISAAPLVSGDRSWMIQCHRAGEDDAVLAA